MPSRNETEIHDLRELLGTGLVNAHALEKQSQSALEVQLKGLDKAPQLKTRVEQYLGETEDQIRRIERAIERNNSKVSAVKDAALSAHGQVVAQIQTLARDDVLKTAIAGHGAAAFETASFASLLAHAEDAGDEDIAAEMRTCFETAKAMQDWLAERIPEITRSFVKAEIGRAA
jgi:ferritin-like metal-binding protein YciE